MKNQSEAKIIDRAKSVLTEQAGAIASLATLLDTSFTQATQAILNLESSGRVIFMGLGKAGFIGMKISATFASLGIASFSIHPSEAAHGDLGRICSTDIVICLSNSGLTLELLQIIPAIKKLGVKIISITGNKSSALAQHSDIVLDIGKLKESGPLGIAPTTSTTVMLALGDALATCVLEAKGITQQEFALNHPGGTIGKSLMLVTEVMRKDEFVCLVEENLTVKEVLRRITSTKGRPGCAAITNKSRKLSGFFTDGDLRRCLEQSTDFLNQPISAIMSRSPKTVDSKLLVEEALAILTKHNIDQVVVINDSAEPIGIIDIQDVVEAF